MPKGKDRGAMLQEMRQGGNENNGVIEQGVLGIQVSGQLP